MNLFQLSAKIFTNSFTNAGRNSLRSVYSSSIGLDKLYPNSSLKLTTPTQKDLPDDPIKKFNGYIPVEQLSITYSRSPGPGGQSVNTSDTKVDLRFHLASAKWLHEDVRNALLSHKSIKLTKEGFLVIRSDKTRSQHLNLTDAMDKLRTLLLNALQPPKVMSPESLEKQRRDREKASRQRLIEKRMKSLTKMGRNDPMM
ncbi:unnamed protein product [Bemisia tabaci]|uniref:Large ribosomal subunit protein mL62 n=1 Tax=Bemisia tabaci TaxID=7038 RepID=A0A9P0AKD9_BEMTA|nr:PREDICTED: peptidyl-tRNA hydrolase ICT1, mitochondrial [Bemisia tabaci]CAH0393685.1 unnamed protein product [Bemisia tabaci]